MKKNTLWIVVMLLSLPGASLFASPARAQTPTVITGELATGHTVLVAVETPIMADEGRNLIIPYALTVEATPSIARPSASATPRFQPDDNVGEAKLQMLGLCGALGFVLVLVFGALASFSLLRRNS